MARTTANFSMREVTSSATIVVTLHRPVHHRAFWWLGSRLMIAGARIAGFAGTQFEGGS